MTRLPINRRLADPRVFGPLVAPVAAALVTIVAIVVTTLPSVSLTDRQVDLLIVALLISIVGYLVGERIVGTESGSQARVGVVGDSISLYSAAARVIRSSSLQTDRRIWAATLVPRGPIDYAAGITDEYDRALEYRLADRTNPWDVRLVFAVQSQRDVDSLLSRLNRQAYVAAISLETRVYVGLGPNTLNPLLVDSSVFFSSRDQRVSVAERGVEVYDAGFAEFVRDYFLRVWDEAPYRVRTRAGVDLDAVEQLRAAIEQSRAGS